MRRAIAGIVAIAALGTVAACSSNRPQNPRHAGATVSASPSEQPPVVAKLGDVLADGPVFGINMPQRTPAALDAVGAATGCRPKWVQFFVSVAAGVTTADIQQVPGTPLMSLEPWRAGQGANQPDFFLRATIDGSWDQAYLKVAHAIMEYRNVVMVRFAHEMNGNWYPWGVVGDNTPSEYIQAWRHVVGLFRQVGATNVLWVWSPNILRGARRVPVTAFYPGDDWVDIVGVTGYGSDEWSPNPTYARTFAQIRGITQKRIILTETGVEPGPAKLSWIQNFGPWLRANADVAGFVWSQRKYGEGATADWRFDDTRADLAAFRATLPVGRVPC